MWKYLIASYLAMAVYVGVSPNRCGAATDQFGVSYENPVHDVFTGLVWPIAIGTYWQRSGDLGGFFTRADPVGCV